MCYKKLDTWLVKIKSAHIFDVRKAHVHREEAFINSINTSYVPPKSFLYLTTVPMAEGTSPEVQDEVKYFTYSYVSFFILSLREYFFVCGKVFPIKTVYITNMNKLFPPKKQRQLLILHFYYIDNIVLRISTCIISLIPQTAINIIPILILQ